MKEDGVNCSTGDHPSTPPELPDRTGGGGLVDAMRASRISQNDLRQAARSAGHLDLSDVQVIVLESDGTIGFLSTVTWSLPS